MDIKRFVRFLWNPSLLLAAILQILPICRTVCTHPAVANSFAIILRWAIGGAVALEAYDCVSGATTVYFTCPTAVTGTVGQAFDFHATITNYQDNTGAFFTNRVMFPAPGTIFPFPAGLSMTNFDRPLVKVNGVYGDIYGTPQNNAVTNNMLVKITACYNGADVSTWPTTNIFFTILPAPSTPPQITAQPSPQTILAGGSATLNVAATGTAPLTYQWQLSGTNVLAATNPSLTLTNIRLSQAGNYSAVVSNSSGAVTSSNALLTVLVPPAPTIVLPPQPPNLFLFSFSPVVGLTNTVVTNNILAPGPWAVLTNIPPPLSATSIVVTDTFNGAAWFYRVQFSP
jgi:hypothetical protein